MKKSFAQIVEDVKNAESRKIIKKIPEWEGKDIVVPSSLSVEQCSSSATAKYKAELILNRFAEKPIDTICDITGGLGVDCMVGFSKIAGKVHYFEMQKDLAEAARQNAKTLGINNIIFHCESITPDSRIPDTDLIYADPSRRNSCGKKVFRLEDCTPDILQLLPTLFASSPMALLKLSPVLDVSILYSCFGKSLSCLHIVSSGGEVKELLCLLKRTPSEEPAEIVVAETQSKETFAFRKEEETEAESVTAKEISKGDTLIEPCAGILKSGAFKLPCNRFGWAAVAPSTHLYICAKGMETPPSKSLLFRYYSIEECLPFGKSTIELLSKRKLKADVKVKNLHNIPSEELRKRLKCSASDERRLHIFACDTPSGAKIMVCKRILP